MCPFYILNNIGGIIWVESKHKNGTSRHAFFEKEVIEKKYGLKYCVFNVFNTFRYNGQQCTCSESFFHLLLETLASTTTI